ncbi:hypothetical protein QNA08_16960 [Chelatococcus sp. SYSU_G07232]|uniref:Uncharacterized protein n=1 Tax=Chelatococcus albus TaxID=3047466 RepID=A0ABT7ALG2_9HYPH|nr:hypothetical protein [Chelatococcus sp. SYSU_G07232]MDJ1159910.1 hypothetical protein [Chelatococcus sp. SYSU_G07232]
MFDNGATVNTGVARGRIQPFTHALRAGLSDAIAPVTPDGLGRGAMVDRIRSILARFPENEEAVRRLIDEIPAFDALCDEYRDASREIEELAKLTTAEAAARADALRRRRQAIEEEILTAIEGHEPV